MRSLLSWLSLPAFAALYLWRASVREFPSGTPWIYLALGVLLFVVYGVDKRAARRGRWRISERNLLVVGVLGGWMGAVVAQQVFRHKTRKSSFQWAFWATVTVNAVVVLAFV
ncbi:DUF1294 domain-containing protein [Frondihabitans sp. PhB188]|uniref:DUF1294 domain-containing protein n=1 Tax=Frondihabitans sp. PhB188 TaxID=2485200 RepID=UPI001F235F80|nr:DUF1294 domain-containing protein [Frondihabitans sp. PhB188]